MPQECLLVKTAPEIILKSSYVRQQFVRKLEQNIRDSARANSIAISKVERSGGRLFIYSPELKKLHAILPNIFGIQNFSFVNSFEFSGIENLCSESVAFAKSDIKNQETFAVRASHSGKQKITSKEIEIAAGDALRTKLNLKVNLSKPEYVLNIELREKKVYLYSNESAGLIGLPLNTAGNLAIICEKKNDSLLSAFLMMQRGSKVILFSDDLKLAKECSEILSKFSNYQPLKHFSVQEFESICRKQKISGVVFSGRPEFEVKKQLAVLYPLQFYPESLKKEKMKIILA